MKILVLGTGAQGTTVAKRLDEEPGVSSIICADYNMEAVNELTGILTKAEGMKCNAYNVDEIIKCAQGVDLIVNALPLEFGKNVLDAALAGPDLSKLHLGRAVGTVVGRRLPANGAGRIGAVRFWLGPWLER